ncbi:MAG: hypothetical protein KH452_11930 [Clostridiales bacterium]|nr:hypothetical protein [Clostridiales bacterium]
MIRMKIAFVLRLTDDFSGQCIRKKKFLFSIGDRVVHPVEKEEGLYIFLEPQEPETRVWIEGTDYYPCSVLIQKKLLDPEEPVADIRLYGRPGKSFPYTCGLLTGAVEKSEKGFPVEVYAKRTKPTGLTFKEYRAVEGAHWLFFQGFTKENLLGRPYVLGKGKDASVFVLTEKRGINEYRAEPEGKPPDRIRSGTPLERIYRSVTDTAGAYAIPVESGEESLITEVMILQYRTPT